MSLRVLLCLTLAGALSACTCAQPPQDVPFKCEPDNTCTEGFVCVAGYCEPIVVSDGGFPCTASADAGFRFAANVCSKDGWCWQHPLPAGATLRDVRGTANGDTWFVGSAGLLMRFDGKAFTGAANASFSDGRSLWGPGDNSLYAIYGGSVLFKPAAGNEWTVFTQYIGHDINALTGYADVRLWAASAFSSSVWELDIVNPNWSEALRFNLGARYFSDAYGVSATEVWAAGELGVIGVRKALPTPPGMWQSVGRRPFGMDGGNLHGLAPLDGGFLVAGQQGFTGFVRPLFDGGVIEDIEGTIVRPRALTQPDINDLFTGPAGRVWGVGGMGFVGAWNGTGWNDETLADAGVLNAVWGTSDDEPWAVGANGRIARRACDVWQDVDYRSTVRRLNGAFLGSDGSAWAVGDNGTVLMRANGSWSATAQGRFPVTTHLRDVWANGAAEVIVVGDQGLISEFDGTSWRGVTGLGGEFWGRIAARSPQSVWVLGRSGSVVRRTNGTWEAPRSINEANGQTLNGIAFDGPQGVWVVANNSTVLYSDDDGATWQNRNSNLPGNIFPNSITVTDDGTPWMGSNQSSLYRYVGGQWESVAIPNSFRPVWNVCAMPGNVVYATGDRGLAAVVIGGVATEQVSTFSNTFEDLSCDRTAGVLSVGDTGAILFHAP